MHDLARVLCRPVRARIRDVARGAAASDFCDRNPRELEPAAMRAMLTRRWGVPESHVVAEYGMTELSSQAYETPLRDAALGRPIGARRLLKLELLCHVINYQLMLIQMERPHQRQIHLSLIGMRFQHLSRKKMDYR